MGFLPTLLGVWRALSLIPALQVEEEEEEGSRLAGIKSVFKVAIITLMNGGDNIGTYVPLFSQAQKGDIAIYVVTYYILLGLWCLAAFVVIRERHILALARKYIRVVIPFLYIGLGLYIIISSSCFPWFIQEIDHKLSTHPGKIIMSLVTTFLLVVSIGAMITLKRRESGAQPPRDNNSAYEIPLEEIPSPTQIKD